MSTKQSLRDTEREEKTRGKGKRKKREGKTGGTRKGEREDQERK